MNWCQHVHDQADHGVFVGRGGFGDQQGQCGEADVVDHRLAGAVEQAAVAVEKIDKQEGAAAFVAIGKRVVLDDEIQQVRGLGFDTGVSRCAEYALVEIAQQGGKGIATFAGK